MKTRLPVGWLLAALLALVPLCGAAPLSLDDALRLALQRNQALKVSAFSPDIAKANVLAEYGRFDPALTFRRSTSEGENLVSTTPLITLTRSLQSLPATLSEISRRSVRFT